MTVDGILAADGGNDVVHPDRPARYDHRTGQLGEVSTCSGEGARMYVNAREGEPFEELYRRFKRGMEASGILREYRRKQRFKPAHEERRDKIRAAARKLRRARAKTR